MFECGTERKFVGRKNDRESLLKTVNDDLKVGFFSPYSQIDNDFRVEKSSETSTNEFTANRMNYFSVDMQSAK